MNDVTSDLDQADKKVEAQEVVEDSCCKPVAEEVSKKAGDDSAKEDFKAKYYYLAAEMDNMRKRFEREKDTWIKYGNEKILNSLVEVVDNLDLTVNAIANEVDPKIKNISVGVEMVRKQFVDVLSQNGLTVIESLGKSFDPNFHEAMGTQKAEGKKENEIIFEYKKGYLLSGRLMRAAKVILVKNQE